MTEIEVRHIAYDVAYKMSLKARRAITVFQLDANRRLAIYVHRETGQPQPYFCIHVTSISMGTSKIPILPDQQLEEHYYLYADGRVKAMASINIKSAIARSHFSLYERHSKEHSGAEACAIGRHQGQPWVRDMLNAIVKILLDPNLQRINPYTGEVLTEDVTPIDRWLGAVNREIDDFSERLNSIPLTPGLHIIEGAVIPPMPPDDLDRVAVEH